MKGKKDGRGQRRNGLFNGKRAPWGKDKPYPFGHNENAYNGKQCKACGYVNHSRSIICDRCDSLLKSGETENAHTRR